MQHFSTPQHLLVGSTHLSMLIVMIQSTELRELMPNVDHTVILFIIVKDMSIVMVPNSDWLILNLDQSSTVSLLITTGGVLGGKGNCCSYSSQESP